jgi:hypothetical protein
VDDASKDDYFESLFYSAAVVGLNTSAFLEGAIVGRPVHTVLLPEFQENQEGVLHFHYLLRVGGGVLQAGRTLEEHHAQLAASIERPVPQPGAGFVQAFVRPRGLDVAATPVFCDAVEELLAQPAPAPAARPLRFVVLRWLMAPAFKALRTVYGSEVFRDDWSRKERERERRREAQMRAKEERRLAQERKVEVRAARRAGLAAEREATLRAREAARLQAEADKAALKRSKQDAKAARQRQKRRAGLRAGLKRRAAGWLRRVGLLGQERAT